MERKITPPSQDDFEAEHHSLYSKDGERKANMKSVLAFAGISPSKFSRRLNDEEPARDHLFDTVMEMYGTVMSGQQDVGQGVVQIVNRYAEEFGLTEDKADFIQRTVEALQAITREAVSAMSTDDLVRNETYLEDLTQLATDLRSGMRAERRQRMGSSAREFAPALGG